MIKIFYNLDSNPDKLAITFQENLAKRKYTNYGVFELDNFDPIKQFLTLNNGTVIIKDYPDTKTKKNPLKEEINKYQKRISDGVSFSNLQGVMLLKMEASDNVKREIENYFKNIHDFLFKGWWISAYREIKRKKPNDFVKEKLYNQIKNYIANYIKKSYGIDEFNKH